MSLDYDELISVENLYQSWRTYKKEKNKKADVMEFERHLEDNLFCLHQELREEIYCHGTYSYFKISDPKKRDIYKSTVRDRRVHQALYGYLCRLYETIFIDFSFSSRKNKGSHKAVKTLFLLAKNFTKNKGKCWAAKGDIKRYFENIDHDILLKILERNIKDEKIRSLLGIIVESFHKETGKAVPLGNITSQIFANVYLNELDKFVSEELKIKNYVRYNDDFVIMENSKEKLLSNADKARVFLKEKLSLDLPKEKVSFRKLDWGIDFCGFIILPNAILARNKTKVRMFKKLELIAERVRFGRKSLNDLQKTADSYFGMLSHGRTYNLKNKIKSDYLYPASLK